MNWLDHALIEPLGLSLLHFLWQGALIGLLYAATLPLTRGATAHARYGVAVLALAALAVAPLVTFGLLLQSGTGASLNPGGAGLEASVLTMRVGGEAGAGSAGVMQWIVFAWLAGVIMLSARLLLGWHFLRRLRRSADFAAAQALRPRLQALVRRLDITRPVALAVSAGIRSPVVIGWLKPLVLLPPAIASGLPAKQLEMVLAHELAHVRRLDHLVNLCQTVIETVLFYHPVVHWVSRRIRIERENACDDLAVAATDDRLAYVEMLASLEKLRFSGPRLALAVHDGQMLSRIRRLVERGRPDRQLGLTGPALLAALLLAATGSLQLLDDETQEQPADTTTAQVPRIEPASPDLPVQEDTTASTPAPRVPAEPEQPAASEAESGRAGVGEQTGEPEPDTTVTAGPADRNVADGNTPESMPADSEPPGMPEMETERLPPVSEMFERPAGSELAMVERPVLSAPTLPDPPARRTLPQPEQALSGGKLIERIEPDYPPTARQRGVDGSVEVEFRVTRDGSVQDVRVLDETPRGLSFAESAREAIAEWRFEPFREGDRPVDHLVRLEVTFDLGDKPRRECRKIIGSRIPRCY